MRCCKSANLGRHRLILEFSKEKKLTLDRRLWRRSGSDIRVGLGGHGGGSVAGDRSSRGGGRQVGPVLRCRGDVGGVELGVRRVVGGVRGMVLGVGLLRRFLMGVSLIRLALLHR